MSESAETNMVIPILQQPATTNMIYISSLGSLEEINFARKILSLKKPDGVNVFRPILVIMPASETTTTTTDDNQDI